MVAGPSASVYNISISDDGQENRDRIRWVRELGFRSRSQELKRVEEKPEGCLGPASYLGSCISLGFQLWVPKRQLIFRLPTLGFCRCKSPLSFSRAKYINASIFAFTGNLLDVVLTGASSRYCFLFFSNLAPSSENH